MVERLKVSLGERAYEIIVGERLIAKAGEFIKPLMKGERAIIISDEHVARLYLHRLTGALEESGIRARPVIVKPGEASKQLSGFPGFMETLLEQAPDRSTMLIALGGGVVGDLAGFAASVLLRGVPFVQIPTTLLAQVDSSVGGKTGLNSTFGKNLVGSFYQPSLVLADTGTLSTLPKRELMAGYAEMLKYGLINDPEFFAWLEKNGSRLLETKPEPLTEAIIRSCKAKAAIVEQDEKEAGIRALLNFGHTFAHALEAETGYSHELLHGEAVAIGMILAFRLSVKMKLCPQKELDRVTAHYQAAGLPLSPRYVQPYWDVEKLLGHMAHDKKAKGGALTFVLTRGIGQAFVQNNADKSMVSQVLAEACQAV